MILDFKFNGDAPAAEHWELCEQIETSKAL